MRVLLGVRKERPMASLWSIFVVTLAPGVSPLSPKSVSVTAFFLSSFLVCVKAMIIFPKLPCCPGSFWRCRAKRSIIRGTCHNSYTRVQNSFFFRRGLSQCVCVWGEDYLLLCCYLFFLFCLSQVADNAPVPPPCLDWMEGQKVRGEGGKERESRFVLTDLMSSWHSTVCSFLFWAMPLPWQVHHRSNGSSDPPIKAPATTTTALSPSASARLLPNNNSSSGTATAGVTSAPPPPQPANAMRTDATAAAPGKLASFLFVKFRCHLLVCLSHAGRNGPGGTGRGPRTITIHRSSAGFGFTLRHFIVYPPDSVTVSQRIPLEGILSTLERKFFLPSCCWCWYKSCGPSSGTGGSGVSIFCRGPFWLSLDLVCECGVGLPVCPP